MSLKTCAHASNRKIHEHVIHEDSKINELYMKIRHFLYETASVVLLLHFIIETIYIQSHHIHSFQFRSILPQHHIVLKYFNTNKILFCCYSWTKKKSFLNA